MKLLLCLILLSFFLPAFGQTIKISPGKYSIYYHINYELTSGYYRVDLEYGFNKGGQFQVYIPKEHFSIAAPQCNKDIILRMPYSENEDKKRDLYNKLIASETVFVVIELNPYINVINKEPLEIELRYCNVFFRHRAGDYYDQL